MGGQIWGGGVIVLVAVALWMLYLLPSWHSRHLYNSAERNAVRLNQALRVLAETSETPEEVRLELNARTAMAQQRLARQSLAEREQVELAEARAELAAARAKAAADREAAERAAAASRAEPAARRARVRRRVRLTATTVVALGLATAGGGTWMLLVTGAQALVWIGGSVTLAGLVVLHRMSRVAARAGTVAVAQAARVAELQDVALPATPAPATWQPRRLPRPLTASAGSRAAAVLDAAAARQALREVALEEAMRERVAQTAPPSIAVARAERESEQRPAASASPFAAMGYVDDAEIEAHVRQLLTQRRAAG
ncbi:MAG: large exoprotein [Microbacterium sp.]|uniref:large exoprotein n=1 Tax=Microbacterium sp. TaxID=51671 RepID=UPI002616A1F5|nr:large exoprotein [Microbacterium sp.]MCX6501636.1 large exoprotein [Microbacterium sp.]